MQKANIHCILVDYKAHQKIAALKKKLSAMPQVNGVIVIDNSPPKENLGFAKAVNLGITQALSHKASHVLLINPDVDLNSNDITKLAQNPADIVGPVLKFTRQGQEILDYGGKVNFLIGRTTHNENKSGPVHYVSGACMLITTKLFDKIGIFDPNFFMYFEDADFCLRASAAGFKVAVDPEVIVSHAISEHKYSDNKLKKKYLLVSNDLFIKKWVPWYVKPLALPYLCFLWLKTVI